MANRSGMQMLQMIQTFLERLAKMVTVSMSTVICKDWLGGVPGAPAGCIPGHEIFFGARSLVVRSDSGCCRFNRATVVSSFSTA